MNLSIDKQFNNNVLDVPVSFEDLDFANKYHRILEVGLIVEHYSLTKAVSSGLCSKEEYTNALVELGIKKYKNN